MYLAPIYFHNHRPSGTSARTKTSHVTIHRKWQWIHIQGIGSVAFGPEQQEQLILKYPKKNRYGPWWEFQCGYTHRLYSNHFKLAKKKFAFLYVTHIVLHTHLDTMIKSVSSISHERIVEISKFESFLNMNHSCWRKINMVLPVDIPLNIAHLALNSGTQLKL